MGCDCYAVALLYDTKGSATLLRHQVFLNSNNLWQPRLPYKAELYSYQLTLSISSSNPEKIIFHVFSSLTFPLAGKLLIFKGAQDGFIDCTPCDASDLVDILKHSPA